MNTHNGHFLHPEVKLHVIKEFARLRKAHPTLDGEGLMAMARDYVWTMALADSAIIRCQILAESL